MVDPVGNGYSSYPRVEKGIDTQAGRTLQGGEKFTLDYQKDAEQEKAKESKEANGGVVLELSGQNGGQRGTYGQQDADRTETSGDTFSFGKVFAGAREFFSDLTGRLSGLWDIVKTALIDFWNSDSQVVVEETAKDEKDAADMGIQPEAVQTEPHAEPMVAESMQHKENMQTDTVQLPKEQTGIYVKNSDLLTYYDRRGKLVKLSGSDRNRILRGDRNSMEG